MVEADVVDQVPQTICHYIRSQSKQELFNVIDYHIDGNMNDSILPAKLLTTLIHQYQDIFHAIISTFDPLVTIIVIQVPHCLFTIDKDQLLKLCPSS